jgi:hypothetical protein
MLKTIDFLGKPVTRLIAGDNPVNGHTYVPDLFTKDDFLEYYTEENVLKAMHDSIEYGYNTWMPLGNDFMLRAIYHHQRREKILCRLFSSLLPPSISQLTCA